ncbi:MAG TPA: hypothetical protein VFH97_09800 [Gemmatimonadales bacterium]|nr:hypothetical protein [Gemmatimonadales bacterium]
MSTPRKRTDQIAEQSPEAFLAALPPDRRREASRVRDLIRRHLPEGYEEVASGKALVFQVPLSRYPDTCNKRPLWFCIEPASERQAIVRLRLDMVGPGMHHTRLHHDERAFRCIPAWLRARVVGKDGQPGRGRQLTQ